MSHILAPDVRFSVFRLSAFNSVSQICVRLNHVVILTNIFAFYHKIVGFCRTGTGDHQARSDTQSTV